MNHITYQTITIVKKTEKSTVLLAMLEGHEEPVIIKRMKTANQEIYRALSEVNSVHIPRIYAMEYLEDELIVAEEYVDGETLEFYLKQGTLSEEQKLKLALQLCDAVNILHSCNPQIIHRDIKPSNILITEAGILKLIDFDASRQYKKMSSDSDTKILGTANYASPEQFGYKQTDVRSDIYSIGIVLERLNFHGKGVVALAWKRMINICTSFDPKKRYKNVQALAKVIRHVLMLQNQQWFYLCSTLCIMVILGWGMLWYVNYAENVESSTTVTPISEEMPMSNIEQIPSLEPTQNVQMLSPTMSVTQEQLAQVEQELKEESIAAKCYHQGVNKDEKLLIYSTELERATGVIRVSLKDLVTGERKSLSEDAYGFEDSIFYLLPDFLQTLQSTYYRIRLEFIEHGGGDICIADHFRVYSSEEPFYESAYVLYGNYLDYYYEVNEKLHAVLRIDNHVKICAVYTEKKVRFPAEQYRILFDGKGIEFSEELLEPCKNQKKTRIIIEFDDGRKEILTIANPYLK